MLASTCVVQLWLAGVSLCAVLVPILHPEFWKLVDEYKVWLACAILVSVWHTGSQYAINAWVTPGTSIARPLIWFFTYALLSTVYFAVRCSAILIASLKCHV
jgi:hypothetical protein